MRRIVNSVFVAAVAFACCLMNPAVHATNAHPGESQIIDFMLQLLNNPAPARMPVESRVNVAVAAATAQAKAMGVQVERTALEAAAIRPEAFFPTSDTSFAWSGASWQMTEHGTYTYTGGKVSTYLTKLWIGSWLNNELTTWSYNGSGTIASTLFQTWDSDSSDWVNSGRSLMSYDGSDRLTTMESQTWDGSTFASSGRVLYTYDGADRIATMTTQEWTGAWNNVSRTTYTYNGSGQETQSVIENYFGGNWLTATRWTSTYDGSNRLTLRVREFYNTFWNNDAKSEYEYNGSGDNTLQRDFIWLSSDWSLLDVDTMKYDGSHRVIQTVSNQVLPFALVTRVDNTYDVSGNLIEEISATLSGTWINTERFVYVYTVLATKVDDAPLPTEFSLLQNHPNPFNPTTTIRYNLASNAHVRVEVHNVLGQLVRVLEDSDQASGVYETTWDGRNSAGQEVASGVYFYSLRSKDFVQTRKMVLSR